MIMWIMGLVDLWIASEDRRRKAKLEAARQRLHLELLDAERKKKAAEK